MNKRVCRQTEYADDRVDKCVCVCVCETEREREGVVVVERLGECVCG